jgi:hypothetical protein
MNPPITDISTVKHIIHRLIEMIEEAADGEESARKNLDNVLGSRSSMVSALSGLTELLFKIEAYEAARANAHGQDTPSIPMDEKDVALVRHFLRRLKSQPREME